MAVQPPKNKEIEIIGFTYKQPKSLKNSSVISDLGLAQNYRLLIRRTDDVGIFNYNGPMELKIAQLPNTLKLFTNESQQMIRDYMQQYFQLFRKFLRKHKDLQWSSGG
jgi:hypothetical protein